MSGSYGWVGFVRCPARSHAGLRLQYCTCGGANTCYHGNDPTTVAHVYPPIGTQQQVQTLPPLARITACVPVLDDVPDGKKKKQ